MIPFEFLADTNAIGKFIDGFIDAGFNIFLKTRSDFDVSDQLASYCLGERGSDIILVQDITAEIMANVDVVAGSQSTLIFDLMKYDKVVWILDTDLNLLTDIPEMGWGRLFKVSDLQSAKQIFDEDVKNKPRHSGRLCLW